jgi:hypothetical protein
MRPLAITVAFWSMLAQTGCQKSGVGLVVSIQSDLAVPTEIDELSFTLTYRQQTVDDQVYPLGGSVDAGVSMPGTISIKAGEDLSEPVTIVAEGRLGNSPIVRRQARSAFAADRILLLTITLLRVCRLCSLDDSCIDPVCEPLVVSDPSLLPDYDPQRALQPMEGGISADAGLDQAGDNGPAARDSASGSDQG